MSGVLQPDFRQGNRSEYLAQYLLSYLGTSILVPRQEDVGIDFNCSISINRGQFDEAKEQYHVQIKSNLTDEIEYGAVVKTGKDKKVKWKKYELDWLFNLDNPLFIGISNKDEGSLELYSTSFKWYNYWNRKFLTIKFLPNSPSGQMEEINACNDEDISDWAIDLDIEEPKLRTFVRTGPPIIKLTQENVRDNELMPRIRSLFRQAILIEHLNIVYKKLNLPYFNWLHKIGTNQGFQNAYFYALDKIPVEQLNKSSAPILIALALLYKHIDSEKSEPIIAVLKMMSRDLIPKEAREKLGL